ncbi:hypothetical protein GGR93_002055 [Sulfitobacter noctilucicola]|uniref:Uncharacterized protein n=1 Tax=Sulfitobacter noctilucicola TaxID=1342301 RepID=A0A7W6M8V2_9RHOB|nr:hypothetical protein [Sulfitobacter noctilucicola]
MDQEVRVALHAVHRSPNRELFLPAAADVMQIPTVQEDRYATLRPHAHHSRL